MSEPGQHRIAIIGGGPAGLMAAEVLCAHGVPVDLYDAMPTLGRKFLMAGKSGLNLTHAEPFDTFRSRFLDAPAPMQEILAAYPPAAIQAWAQSLGVETFTGTSGRVFPTQMKAAPLLRAWLKRLRDQGMRMHVKHRWLGWDTDGSLLFEGPAGRLTHTAQVTILALGGASWPRLGSDGAWVGPLGARGVDIAPLAPSNCGFDVKWSDHFRTRHEGSPLKAIALKLGDVQARGECMITNSGLEGGPLYTLSAPLRDAIARDGAVPLTLDLAPDSDTASLREKLSRPRGKSSLSNHLRKTVGLTGAKAALLMEDPATRHAQDPAQLAERIKTLPLTIENPRPIAEAISTAGGITWDALTPALELKALPSVYAAGEMLTWDAPTGGYLLTACMATGHWVGNAVLRGVVGRDQG